MLKARMNAVYYERLIARSETWDRWLRVVAAILSSAGVIAAISWIDNKGLAIGVGVAAACLNAVSLVWSFAERGRAAATMLPQYIEHWHRLRDLYEAGDDVDEGELKKALAALDQSAVLEAEKIRTSKPGLLKKAQATVIKEMGLVS